MKRICRKQYEKDFDEMFKLDKKGLMTDIDCYVSNLENSIKRLEKGNQSLKKQLEEKDTLIKQCDLSIANVMDCYCERTDCSGRIKDSKQYDSLVQKVENQQKEFIDYLENEIKSCELTIDLIFSHNKEMKIYQEILSKYKEIIGGK